MKLFIILLIILLISGKSVGMLPVLFLSLVICIFSLIFLMTLLEVINFIYLLKN